MAHDTKTYKAAIRISEEYLGPAGERFMDRQITTHLNIQPEKLQAKHINELVQWVQLAFAVLTDDSQEIRTFTNKLRVLAGSTSRAHKGKVTKINTKNGSKK